MPERPLIVAAGSEYLQAISSDLKAARGQLKPGVPMIVITCDHRIHQDLSGVSLLFDSRLQRLVGGSRISLPVRILRFLLDGVRVTGLTLAAWEKRIRAASGDQSRGQHCTRLRMSEAEIRSFVIRERKARPRASHSLLLQELRRSGRACEQQRFRDLYAQVIAEGS
jgi:hypothetical protein